MTSIPNEIHDDEVIVRALCSPFHLDRRTGKPTWTAFKAPPDRKDVSVIRHDYVGGDFCKRKAQELTNPSKTYRGLAFMHAKAIRRGPDVVDSREVYVGHADIIHRFPAPPRGQPYEGPDLEALRDDCKRILEGVRYIEDPNPEGDKWTEGCPQLP